MFRPVGNCLTWKDSQACVDQYRQWLREMDRSRLYGWLIDPIVGFNLLCWCPLGAPCHADILLALANEELVRLWNEKTAAMRVVAPEKVHT